MSPRRNSWKSLFVCVIAYWGQNVNVDREEGAGGPTIRRSLSHASSFAMSVSACSLVWREREGEQTRKSGRRDVLKWTSFVCFFAALQDVGLLKNINELFFINGVVDGTSGERFLIDITFRISSVKYRVYYLVFCLFFPHSRVDFQKKVDEKHKKQTSCPKAKFQKIVYWPKSKTKNCAKSRNILG